MTEVRVVARIGGRDVELVVRGELAQQLRVGQLDGLSVSLPAVPAVACPLRPAPVLGGLARP